MQIPFAFRGNFLFLFQRFVEKKMLKWCSNLLQERYSKQRDKMLEAYFTCSIFIFVSLYILQMIAIPEWVWQRGWACLFTQPYLEYTTSKKVSSTSSYFDRIIPLYPQDDHFSRVSLATRINQTWSMRPSKEWLVSSTSKSSPYFWVKMEQFVCESSVLVKGGLLPMHSLACFDRIITLISFTTTTTYQINCPTKYKKRNSM